jgi:UDP-glucose 4-epimerase
LIISVSGRTGSIGRHLQRVESFTTRLAEAASNFDNEFKYSKPEAFIHLAAITDIKSAANFEELSYEINVVGAVKTMQAFARNGGRRFIFASTGHVYGLTEPGDFALESDTPMPKSVYAKHKLIAEEKLSQIALGHDIELVNARIFSVFGENMAEHYLASKIFNSQISSSISADYPLVKNGLDVRDFLEPVTVANILYKLATIDNIKSHGETINICSGKPLTVMDRILIEFPKWPEGRIEKNNSETPYLVGSNKKIQKILPG